jgi:hypothetical protein
MVAAQVRRTRQRADKHSKVPRELPDLVLPSDGICTRRIISHGLSLPVHARQVSLLTSRAGIVAWSFPYFARTFDSG